MADKRNQIRFIHSSHHERPGAASAQTQQQVRSQAARAAHAKARRQRTANYQAIEARNRSDGHPEQSCSSSSTTEVETSVLSSPVMLLGYGRRDPFASFARPLSPIEDFLLDYCKSGFSSVRHGLCVLQIRCLLMSAPGRIFSVTYILPTDRQSKCCPVLNTSRQRYYPPT